MKKLLLILLCLPMIGIGQIYENRIDKIVYNTEHDLYDSENNVTDVLRKAPLLSVDLNDNVSLSGSKSIEFLVNGEAHSFIAIMTIRAKEIKQVEIITDTRGKYLAKEYVGTVNIITKRKRWLNEDRRLLIKEREREAFILANKAKEEADAKARQAKEVAKELAEATAAEAKRKAEELEEWNQKFGNQIKKITKTEYNYTQKFGEPELSHTNKEVSEYFINGQKQSIDAGSTSKTYYESGQIKEEENFYWKKKYNLKGDTISSAHKSSKNAWRIGFYIEPTVLFESDKFIYKYTISSYYHNVYQQKVTTVYDSNNNKKEETLYKPIYIRRINSDEGYHLKQSAYKKIEEDEIESKAIYKYDSNGDIASVTKYNSVGEIDQKIIKKYDPNGHNTLVGRYNSSGEIIKKILKRYDSNGNCTLETTYNSAGEVEEKIAKNYDENNYNYETIEHRKPIKGTLYLDSYTLKRKGKNGLVDKEINYFAPDVDDKGNIEANCGNRSTANGYRYKYDENSKKIRTIEYSLLPDYGVYNKEKAVLNEIISNTAYNGTFDEEGNLVEGVEERYNITNGKRGKTTYKKSIQKADNTIIIEFYDVGDGYGNPWYSKEIKKIDNNNIIEIERYNINEGLPWGIKNLKFSDFKAEFSSHEKKYYPNEKEVLTYSIKNKFGENEEVLIKKEVTEIEYYRKDAYIGEDDDGEVFMAVENMPEFPGGVTGLMKYIQKNVKYPPISKEYNITGKVYVQFIVNKSGSVTNVKVVRGVDKNLDAEAVRVIKSLPKYKPGKQRGKPVRVMFTAPINFWLN